jgi:hypothetical protein
MELTLAAPPTALALRLRRALVAGAGAAPDVSSVAVPSSAPSVPAGPSTSSGEHVDLAPVGVGPGLQRADRDASDLADAVETGRLGDALPADALDACDAPDTVAAQPDPDLDLLAEAAARSGDPALIAAAAHFAERRRSGSLITAAAPPAPTRRLPVVRAVVALAVVVVLAWWLLGR